jgi:hypothetical protein
MRKEGLPTGYFDRELTKRLRDRKEVFDLLSPDLPDEFNPNVWPEWLPGFRETVTEYFDAVIEPIPELCEGPPRYRSFTWREFGIGRASDNYADRGDDDIQISNFRVA